jgi:hypothetical protein
VLALIEAQAAKIPQTIDALLLVGGFSGCEYLFKKVDVSKFLQGANFLHAMYFGLNVDDIHRSASVLISRS